MAVSGASIWAAGEIGMAIGTGVGMIIPGAGNVAGAIGGFVVGVVGYILTDVITIKKKSLREHLKDNFNDFFGWR